MKFNVTMERDELACNLLDTIRFLFKSNQYREEQEVRVTGES